MARKIAILNQKGGVAKTTTAINLAFGLASTGRRTLIIDLDPQGHIALGLGLELGDNVYNLLRSNIPAKDLVVEAREVVPLYVIPGGRKTSDAESELVSTTFREKVLNKRLKELEEYFHYIILDCSPSFSVINQNALIATNEVLIPMTMDFFAAAGTFDIKNTLNGLELGENIVTGVIPTFFNPRTKKTQQMMDYLTNEFKDRVTNPIRVNTKISEAQGMGKTIFEYDQSSNGAKDYVELVKWVVNNE